MLFRYDKTNKFSCKSIQQNTAISTQKQDVAKITDEIANSKEFDGKNSVKGRNLNISSFNYNLNVAVSKKTSIVFNKKVEKTIVAKTQEVDNWETFKSFPLT